jgi:hypothetical protein
MSAIIDFYPLSISPASRGDLVKRRLCSLPVNGEGWGGVRKAQVNGNKFDAIIPVHSRALAYQLSAYFTRITRLGHYHTFASKGGTYCTQYVPSLAIYLELF